MVVHCVATVSQESCKLYLQASQNHARSKVSPFYIRRDWSSEIMSDSLVPLGKKCQSPHLSDSRVYPLSGFHTVYLSSFAPWGVSDSCQGRGPDRGQRDPGVHSHNLVSRRETWSQAARQWGASWLVEEPGLNQRYWALRKAVSCSQQVDAEEEIP